MLISCEARNILLLTLIIDDHDGRQNDRSLWGIYYHLYLDKRTLDLLRSQSRKLHELSATLQTWQQSKYGCQLKFCDSASLAAVRRMWEFYGVEPNGDEASDFRRRFEEAIRRAKDEKDAKAGGSTESMVLTSFRSAVPAHVKALKDLDALHKHYWQYGSLELKSKARKKAKHPNPTFMTLDNTTTLQYGLDPLLGFHVATAYVPLDSKNTIHDQLKGLSQEEKLVAAARMEFSDWMASYSKNHKNMTFRFFVGEAAAFAHTLQQKRVAQANTACQYKDPFHLRPLILDGTDYELGIAPLTYDVIDTSNLCDHLGSLILLTATTPLLRNGLSSTLYTDVIVKHFRSHNEILENLLCGHVATLSTLLGLFPVDYWTNTSCLSSGDETMLDILTGTALDASTETRATDIQNRQMFLRVCWKRPFCMQGPTAPCLGLAKIQFDEDQLARVLYEIYLYMFRDEDLIRKFADTSLEAFRKSSLVWYHRGSFTSFLRLIKTRATCDWNAAMSILIGLI